MYAVVPKSLATSKVGLSAWLIALVFLSFCPVFGGGMQHGEIDDAASLYSGGDSIGGGRMVGSLATLALSLATVKVCRLCNSRSDSDSPLPRTPNDIYDGKRPWLHYKRIPGPNPGDEDMKEASGKVCGICWRVFMMSPLSVTHGSIGAYIQWRNSGDSQSRHAAFMRGLKTYIASLGKKEGKLHTRRFRFVCVRVIAGV